MPNLDKKLFAGERDLAVADCNHAQISNLSGDVDAALKKFGWDAATRYACVSLGLSSDNKRVEKGTFLIRGTLDTKINVEAAKIWSGANKAVIAVFSFPDAGIFTFSEGDLGSDIVQQEAIDHTFYLIRDGRPPTPILEADYEQHGIGSVAMRMTCTLSSTSSIKEGVVVKYTILLFPLSKESLLASYELAQCAAWPGLRLSEGRMALGPRPSTPWGCPIVPLILGGRPTGESCSVPAGVLRYAIASMMSKTVEPEMARSGTALLDKWKRLAANPNELMVKAGDLTWPTATAPPPDHG